LCANHWIVNYRPYVCLSNFCVMINNEVWVQSYNVCVGHAPPHSRWQLELDASAVKRRVPYTREHLLRKGQIMGWCHFLHRSTARTRRLMCIARTRHGNLCVHHATANAHTLCTLTHERVFDVSSIYDVRRQIDCNWCWRKYKLARWSERASCHYC
jgi:hypothetical protein